MNFVVLSREIYNVSVLSGSGHPDSGKIKGERERPKGASIYDVRTEGGRGVSPKEDVGGCVNLVL